LKNNFCAVGPIQRLAFRDFLGLQLEADQHWGEPEGGSRPPLDRTPFLHLGEGRLVQISGYILGAHFGGPESVNCRLRGPDNSDMHLTIGEEPVADRCATLTAELSPHLRPATITLQSLKAIEGPVRVTGQLFFDASHTPCGLGGQQYSHSLPRLSNWEIHPVYNIEVCKRPNPTSCRLDHDDDWAGLSPS
jgi:hypothetical protein